MKKITLLLVVVFAFTATNIYGQAAAIASPITN